VIEMKAAAGLLVAASLLSTPLFAADVLLTLDSQDWRDIRSAIEGIRLHGGEVKIVVVPHFIIADVPAQVAPYIVEHTAVSAAYTGILTPERFAGYGSLSHHVIAAWNRVYTEQADERNQVEETSLRPPPLVNDLAPFSGSGASLAGAGAGFYEVTEYLLGDVAVIAFLPESDGSIDPNLEDWSQPELDNVTSEVIEALDWWLAEAKWREIAFYLVPAYQVPTGYEPITRSARAESLWIPDCLEHIGYAPAEYPFTMFTYANDVRDSLGTDWVMIGFCVDSSNDEDGMFDNGMFAYADWRLKFMMTYDNASWGIEKMDEVFAHESAHVFGALDEYYGTWAVCTERDGYLAVENQNSVEPDGPGGCLMNHPLCVMRSPISKPTICKYTKGQIGWWDSDRDSVPDVLDTHPETVLQTYSPDPCTTFTPTYAGTCWVVPLPNLNPRGGERNPVSLNLVSGVEYRFDGGPWTSASSNDGAWDSQGEGYHFTTEMLSEGTHTIEARAVNSVGNCDMSPAVDTLTISLSSVVGVSEVRAFVWIGPNPHRAGARLRYAVPGMPGSRVRVHLAIYDIKGRRVAELFQGCRKPGVYDASWDGLTFEGETASSGLYFLRMDAGSVSMTRKLVLIR
jgi:hypothetical protein